VVPGQAGRNSDRLDLLLQRDGGQVAAIEVKLLSDLGPQQLARYRVAFPSAGEYRVLHLERLPVNLRGAAPWESLTWESFLGAHVRSENPWVATTAQAWLAQLASLVPVVNQGFRPHRLRHTAAHRWLAAGGSESGFMSIAGWPRTDMLIRYTRARASELAADEARRLNLGHI
jgi:hypothetical protein